MRGSYIPLRTVGFRISVDTGGTFTDVVVADEEGRLRIGKALTTRERAFDAIAEGLAQIAPELGLEVGQLLAQADVLAYGTTRATNAIVEGTTARTAFFTTEGFPDVLLLREGGKHDPFGQQAYAPPYVPRFLTFEISERMDSEGQPFAPLEEASVAASDRGGAGPAGGGGRRYACSGRSSTRRTSCASASCSTSSGRACPTRSRIG